MRCNNCGWDNKEDAVVCIKCDTALEKSSPRPPAGGMKTYEATVFESKVDLPPHSSEAQPGKVYARTVSDVPGAAADTNPNEDEFLTCGSCGYLNPGEAKVCAKCRLPLGVPAKRAEPIIDERSLAEQPAPDPAPEVKASFRATVDPYRKGIVVENNCRLRLVPREGEIKPGTVGFFPVNERHFTAQSTPIELNRTNLEEANLTITSKVQAELFFENGKWYLLDRSELETTFVRATNKIELREGDLILMGDRKFLFSAE